MPDSYLRFSRNLPSCKLALDNTALNVVCNQEYAQAVPHVRTLACQLNSINQPVSELGSLSHHPCPEIWISSGKPSERPGDHTTFTEGDAQGRI